MTASSKTQRMAIFNLIALIVVLAMNTLAVALPLFGRDTGEISDLYPNLFVPAGWAFSIWSLIYLSLIFFAFRTLFATQNRSVQDNIGRIGYWFILSCVSNALWIVCWHSLLIIPAMICMLGILISLIQVHTRLGGMRRRIGTLNFFTFYFPFSLYLGWITIATVANVTALLVDHDFGGFGLADSTWAVAIIIVATLIAAIFSLKRLDFIYALVPVWAFGAILSKRLATDVAVESVGNTAAACAVVMLIIALSTFIMTRRISR